MSMHDPLLDHRARVERALFEAAERRDRARIDQSSPRLTPAERVNVWERLHGVRLPKDPAHAILRQVAQSTALQLAEVLEIQRQRAEPVVALP
jgi:hypothetical protein